MKSLITVFVFIASASVGFSQHFTIISPREGQKVREVVSLTFPKDSVRAGSFIGISVDGKFLEAAVPELDEKAGVLVYKLNTKALGIKDGERTIGAVRYQNVGGTTMITDRSEVKVMVVNYSDIKVPEEGLLLRYKWRPGSNWVYSETVEVDQAMMTEAQNRMGGRAARLPIHQEHSRLGISVEDVKRGAKGNLGLVRARILPYKGEGKDYTFVTIGGETAPRVIHESKFASVYRLLTETGLEEYADTPVWHGFFGTSQGNVREYVYNFMPLPILPEQPQRIGDSWTGSIAIPAASLERVEKEGKANELMKARGVLEGVEWELGHPCAKIRYTVEAAERLPDSETLHIAGREFRANERLRWQQVFWLDIEQGFIVRTDISFTADVKVDVPTTAQGAAAAGRGGPAAAAAGAGGGPPMGPPGTTGGGGGGGTAQNPRDNRFQGSGGGSLMNPGDTDPTPRGGAAGTGTGAGRTGPQQAMFVRQTLTIKLVLEK